MAEQHNYRDDFFHNRAALLKNPFLLHALSHSFKNQHAIQN